MADRALRSGVKATTTTTSAPPDDAERKLARAFALGLPAATVLGAAIAGALANVSVALLVLAAGMLVGVIGLFWASLRTLSGDAPLPEGLEAVTARARVTSASEEKRQILRALKDLELERDIGKMDDADYARLAARYREEAKTILREMDFEIEPLRARAEAIARAHLVKRGLQDAPPAEGPAEADASAPSPGAGEPPAASRPTCPKCATSNEPDALFCKKCGTPFGAPSEPAEARDASA